MVKNLLPGMIVTIQPVEHWIETYGVKQLKWQARAGDGRIFAHNYEGPGFSIDGHGEYSLPFVKDLSEHEFVLANIIGTDAVLREQDSQRVLFCPADMVAIPEPKEGLTPDSDLMSILQCK